MLFLTFFIDIFAIELNTTKMILNDFFLFTTYGLFFFLPIRRYL